MDSHAAINASPQTASKRMVLFGYIIYLFFLALIFLALAEWIIRADGVRPWETPSISINVQPGGRFFQKDPSLGYKHIPGHFTVTLGTGYTFTTTNLPNTLRLTHPISSYPAAADKPEIWIFGCSYTYGWTLNDHETYPWLLQAKLPDYEVVNFGVNGYGTIHSLIQLREALKTKSPKVVILAYANFHDERNTFLRNRQKAVAPWNKLGPLVQPYARLNGDGTLHYAMSSVEYDEFPLMRTSALAHFIEIKYDQYEDQLYNSHAVSEALINEMNELATSSDVQFVLANIEGDSRILKFARDHSIAAVDISVDLDVPGYRNLPHDGHPSALANRLYADKLERYLNDQILDQPNVSL